MSLEKSLQRLVLSVILLLSVGAWGQASYRAEIRGVVTDPTGAVLTNASVIIVEVGTNLSTSAKTDGNGYYILRGLRPSTYTIRVSAPGFREVEQRDLVLAVNQAATLNFSLKPAGTTTEVQVTGAAPLLDTESSSLGTDITNDYVKQMPLLNRNFVGLVYLNAGVTEVSGAGANDNYPSGTNFVSNGQRNATAEVRVDGALISAPEQGEGGNSNVYYEPSVEIVQEFKVQNNSFSSEFGNNGGTVVNMVLKSGTNAFHGSAWWFGQRGWLDANDFFNNQNGIARPGHTRDQYGFSLGGPIRKNKTFFFVDLERVNDKAPVPIVATVPTPLERQGDFSQTNIVDPNSGNLVPDQIFNPNQVGGGVRSPFPNNKIAPQWIDPIGQKVLSLYPLPNVASNPDGTNNFRDNTTDHSKSLQFDVKLDHQINDRSKIMGRYSRAHSTDNVPTIFGDGEFGPSGDGINFLTNAQNGSLEYNWTPTQTILWNTRFAVDRVHAPGFSTYPDPTQLGFPSQLTTANPGIAHRMPGILVDTPWTSLYDQCCVDTNFAHTLYSYASSLSLVRGKHNFKFGGEQRLFYNNFQQPSYPTGYFHFAQAVTENVIGAFNPVQGNPFADILLGWGDYGGISVYPAVADKSKETAFFFQDDWKVTPKLTVNLGLRYEWSTPYSERHNRLQFSDFTGNSGISVPGLPLVSGNLLGTTRFAGPRNAPADRNNFGPRLGFSYAMGRDTVLRGGAGIYYGMNVATNFQYPGPAFRKDGVIYFTKDNFDTRYASFANPFPAGLPAPQGTKYGALAMWGFANASDLGTQTVNNADVYQWSLGVQRLLPGQMVVSVDYSANRSTHLPWGGAGGASGVTTRDRNFIPSWLRNQYASLDGYNALHNTVPNPFQPLFTGPNAIFNEPDSLYNDAQIPLINLLRPYPQFDGAYEGLPLLGAESFYNAMQVRFQKRASHYVSFEGNYTLAKATDDSSSGRNAWLGNLYLDNPQVFDDLKAEHSISANDTTHRLAAAVIVDLPFGRNRWLGRGMNRVLDGIAGGWTVSTFWTLQTGQPIAVTMSQPTLDDGNQRPNVICAPRSGVSAHQSALTGQSMFNTSCFSTPNYETPGNAPRYFPNLRDDGIRNVDFAASKSFVPREGMKLEVRAEFFNFFNTARFAIPDVFYGDSTFGVISSTAQGSTPRHGQFGVRFEF